MAFVKIFASKFWLDMIMTSAYFLDTHLLLAKLDLASGISVGKHDISKWRMKCLRPSNTYMLTEHLNKTTYHVFFQISIDGR